MAGDVVIRAEGLGKKYVIGHQAERETYTTLRESMVRSLRNWGRSARDMMRGKALVAGDETEEFWALKDVNFEIRRGDVVGIIGRNGAGKSTLLKVLSRITEPTQGQVTIYGRVASLLEVGTGFHPELTGRENIFLNGAILGMSRAEIRRKFDEIVDFAGIEKFLDTPVKRYSSGMYVRLAFAVAAHLEPEILVVDEVLAVGDAEFQKKCLGKMRDVAGHGRTVLFVSHNMAAVQSLCGRALLLQAGGVVHDGGTEGALEAYAAGRTHQTRARRSARSDQDVTITAVAALLAEDHLIFEFEAMARRPVQAALEINILDRNGAPAAFAEAGCWNGQQQLALPPGESAFAVMINTRYLAAGSYGASLALSKPGVSYLDRWIEAVSFEIDVNLRSGETGTLHQSQGHGAVRLDCRVDPLPPSLPRNDLS